MAHKFKRNMLVNIIIIIIIIILLPSTPSIQKECRHKILSPFQSSFDFFMPNLITHLIQIFVQYITLFCYSLIY